MALLVVMIGRVIRPPRAVLETLKEVNAANWPTEETRTALARANVTQYYWMRTSSEGPKRPRRGASTASVRRKRVPHYIKEKVLSAARSRGVKLPCKNPDIYRDQSHLLVLVEPRTRRSEGQAPKTTRTEIALRDIIDEDELEHIERLDCMMLYSDFDALLSQLEQGEVTRIIWSDDNRTVFAWVRSKDHKR